MANTTISVGKKRNCTFECMDQNNQPIATDITGIPRWVLGELVARGGVGTNEVPTGFTLTPSADGLNCDVAATAENVSAALHCYANRASDGVEVHGGAVIESVGTGGAVPAITYLKLKFGEES